MTRPIKASEPSIEDEDELDRLISDETANASTILQALREELSAGEAQLRRMGEDLAASRGAQAKLGVANAVLGEEAARLKVELSLAKSAAEGFQQERDTLDEKMRDMIKVSELELIKVISHAERLQQLSFSEDKVAGLERVNELEAALAAERALSAKRLEDLKGTQAHRAILEQKIGGMLGVMHAETQKVVDHTERQFASVLQGLEARQRIDAEVARSAASESREQAAQAVLAAVYRSTSWRLTKPWRFAGRLLARLGVKRGSR